MIHPNVLMGLNDRLHYVDMIPWIYKLEAIVTLTSVGLTSSRPTQIVSSASHKSTWALAWSTAPAGELFESPMR